MSRIIEIDITKGIAVIMMVIYHLFYMAYLMNKPIIDINLPWVSAMAVLSHSIFIYMVGVNLHISYKKDPDGFYRKQSLRALKLLGYGLLMTLITYLIYPNAFIRYGIFHFIASAIIISMVFIQTKLKASFGILLFMIMAFYIENNKDTFGYMCLNTKNLCFNLGLYNNFNSIDHFSFIPFFIYVLLGIKTGQIIYPQLKSPLNIKENKITNGLAIIGKYSLNIYLVHWVIIYILLVLTPSY
jgi:uncharacterized membrane protein